MLIIPKLQEVCQNICSYFFSLQTENIIRFSDTAFTLKKKERKQNENK